MSVASSPPLSSSYTPVPDALLGQFLEHPGNPLELPCLLRTLHLLYRETATPKAITLASLERDTVLRQLLTQASGGFSLVEALQRAAATGVLLRATSSSGGEVRYLLDTRANRNQLVERGWTVIPPQETASAATLESQEEWPSIFTLYEHYVGTLTPLIAEELKDAESNYPDVLVREAFDEAVRRDKRSWRYIARILERWTKEGRDYGEPGRHPQAGDYQAYLASWRNSPSE